MSIIDRRGATVSATSAPSSSTPNADLAIKTACRVATAGTNINLQTFGLGIIDGVQLVAGDRVLVKDQTNTTQNGIYNASTGVWAMSSDFQNNSQVVDGCQVFINFGTLNVQSTWVLSATDPIVLGTTHVAFVSISARLGKPSKSPAATTYQVTASDNNVLIESGSAGGAMTVTLPNPAAVSNGFTVGFLRTGNNLTILDSTLGSNIHMPVGPSGGGGFLSSLTLTAEADVLWLTVDQNFNWRPSGGSAQPTIPFVTPLAFPGPGDPAVALGIKYGHAVPFLDENVVFSGNGVFPFQIVSTNPYCIGTNGTIGSSTVGQTFKLVFTSAALTGSPITITYTAVAGDTVSTISTKLAAAVNANAVLNVGGTTLPVFAEDINQTSPGLFNLQWSAALTTLTVASTGSTGTITGLAAPSRTLDFAVTIIGRRVPGYVGQDGDNCHALEFMGQSNSGAMDAVIGVITASLPSATGGTITGRMSFSTSVNSAGVGQFAIQSGMILYGAAGVLPTGGFLGTGTINLPSTGSLNIAGGAGAQIANGQVVCNNIYGGAVAASALNLQSTASGSPSGDFVQIKAGGVIGYKFDGTTSTFGVASSLRGQLALAGNTSGTLTLRGPSTASGTLTLPAGTTDFSATGGTSQVVKQVTAGAAFTVAQLAFTDISGTLGATQFGPLTGDVTTSSYVSTVAKIAGTTVSGTTGTGSVAFSASPTFTGTLTAASYAGSDNMILTKTTGVLSQNLTTNDSQVQNTWTGASGGASLTIRDSAAGADLKFFQFVSSAGSSTYRTLTDVGAVKNTHVVFDHSSGNTTISQDTGLGTTALTSAFVAIAAGTTAKSQINFAAATAPTSPNNGDFWFDGTNVKIRVSGATKTFTLT